MFPEKIARMKITPTPIQSVYQPSPLIFLQGTITWMTDYISNDGKTATHYVRKALVPKGSEITLRDLEEQSHMPGHRIALITVINRWTDSIGDLQEDMLLLKAGTLTERLARCQAEFFANEEVYKEWKYL